MAEAINVLHKTELVRARGPWRTVEQVELATLEWVWWWNNQRLHSALDYRTPIEAGHEYYADTESLLKATASQENTYERNPGRFSQVGGPAYMCDARSPIASVNTRLAFSQVPRAEELLEGRL